MKPCLFCHSKLQVPQPAHACSNPGTTRASLLVVCLLKWVRTPKLADLALWHTKKGHFLVYELLDACVFSFSLALRLEIQHNSSSDCFFLISAALWTREKGPALSSVNLSFCRLNRRGRGVRTGDHNGDCGSSDDPFKIRDQQRAQP